MFDPLVHELSERYGLGDRGRDLFGLLMAYIHNDRRGGFGGFIEGFREQGHGELVASWLGNPGAGGLTASDVGMVFGQGLLNDWGARLGASRATVAAAIAGVLPRLVAELTPGGRIPGGFAAPGPLDADASRPVPATPTPPMRGGMPAHDTRPQVAAPYADEAFADETITDPRPPASDAEALPDPGRIVPGDERRLDTPGAGPRPARPRSQPLRREPSFAATAPREPVEPRRVHESDARDGRARSGLDPAGDRLAEMTAAFDARGRHERDGRRPGTAPGPRSDDGWRPEGWRPAMHPPRRGRGWRRLFWLVVLLVLIACAAWYVWAQGLLDPYIEQLDVPIRSTPSTL